MTYLYEHLHHDIPTSGHSRHGIPTKEHLHHCIPKRGHSHHKHTPKRTFASWHAPRRHLHHDIPTRSICIMTCPLEGICTTRHFASTSLQGDICIMAFLQRDICIMTYPLEDIHISISARRHLHHGNYICILVKEH